MDAVEYLKTLARMHNKQADCAHCVLPNGCDITKDAGEIKKRVEIVEKWGKENPVKTRKDELLKVFPYAPLTCDGVPKICPGNVDGKRYTADKTGYNCPDSCLKCREKYWLEEGN